MSLFLSLSLPFVSLDARYDAIRTMHFVREEGNKEKRMINASTVKVLEEKKEKDFQIPLSPYRLIVVNSLRFRHYDDSLIYYALLMYVYTFFQT